MVFPGETQPSLPLSNECGSNYSNNNSHYPLYSTYPRKHHSASAAPASPPSNGGIHNHLSPSSLYSAAAGTAGLLSANPDSVGLRSILRNKYEYTPIRQHIYDSSLAADDTADTQLTPNSNSDAPFAVGLCPEHPAYSASYHGTSRLGFFLDRYIRPATAELISVVFASFTVTFIESMLLALTVHRVIQVAVEATAEGIVFATFLATFYNNDIHFNPALSLGALFAGGISPLLCVFYWVCQVVGACLGVFCYQIVAAGEIHISLPSLSQSDVRRDSWFRSMYQLVLCQTITTAILVLSYLQTYLDRAKHTRTPIGPACAVGLCAFVSLLVSTASWNPARSLAICLVSTVNDIDVTTWHYHYIFWLGPVIGALFASFFYRLIFAEGEKRLRCCKPHLVVM